MFSFGVMASGGGSNFRAILSHIGDGTLQGVCKFLVVNNSGCGAAEIAREHGVPVFHVSSKTHPVEAAYDAALLEILAEFKPDLLLLAGYMKKVPDAVVDAMPGRILNVHPALLPKFGGKNFWGMNVHRAVLAAHERESGPSIHLVTHEIDRGKVLAQAKVPVLAGDTPEALAARVLVEEHKLYWKTVGEYAKSLGLV